MSNTNVENEENNVKNETSTTESAQPAALTPEQAKRLARRQASERAAAAALRLAAHRAAKDAALNAALRGTKGDERVSLRDKLVRDSLPDVTTVLAGLSRGDGTVYTLAHTITTDKGTFRLAGSLVAARETRVLASEQVAGGAETRAVARKKVASSVAAEARKGLDGDAARFAGKAAREAFATRGLPLDCSVRLTFTALPGAKPGVLFATGSLTAADGEWTVSGRATVTDWILADTDSFMA